MKKIISISLAIVMTLSIAACGGKPAVAPTEADTGSGEHVIDLSAKEAPILTEMVTNGAIPKLEERLPSQSDLMVETDVVELGAYGGSIVTTTIDSGRWNIAFWTEQGLFRFKQDASGEVEPNVAKEYSSNEDGTVWTIKLREGMRWSDGAPFTADDVIFYYDHMSTPSLDENRAALLVEDPNYYSPYTSKAYTCYQVGIEGENVWAAVEKVNDYEFTVTFPSPKPGFPEALAVDNKWMFLPKHFYINYVSRKDGITDDASFPSITEEEAIANANRDFKKQWDSYSTMGKDIGYYHWDYYIVPQIRTFIATKDNWNTVGETYEMVRNPYFWKVDSEGRQLPYADNLKFKIINEQDQIVLQASSGEFDLVFRDEAYSTIATETKDTHHTVVWTEPGWSTKENLTLNQTVKDLDKRALFQDKRFREALSICVDRDLINETSRNGMGTPAQAAPAKGSPAYDAEWSKKWAEFDLTRANQLMDEITEPWDKKEGTYRKMLGTNKDVEIIVSIKEPGLSGDFISILQSSYKAIGVKLIDKVDAEYRVAALSNDVEACVEEIISVSPALRPDSTVPMRNAGSIWYSAFGKWYEDGKSEANGGIAPTGDVLELIQAYEVIRSATGSDRGEVIEKNVQIIHDLHKENIWVIGYLATMPARQIVSNKLHNVPQIVHADEFRFVNLARPEQFWKSE